MKRAVLLLAISALQTNLVYAEDIQCPSVAAIQSLGLDYVQKTNIGESWMAVKQNQTYGTEDTWNLIIWPIDAKNEIKAMSKALKLLPFLDFASSRYSSDGFKVCDYISGSEMLYIWATTNLQPQI